MKCTEENEKKWKPSYDNGYDDGYFEEDLKKGEAQAKFKDAYMAGYNQGHSDKYNPE